MKKTVISKSYSQASYILPTRTAPVATKQVDADEQAYLEWKKANGLDKPLSRQQYEVAFGIYA